MEQTLNEQNGDTYTQQGDYYLPDIKLPKQTEYELGVWGQRRRRYLKENHRVLYYNMLTKCILYPHHITSIFDFVPCFYKERKQGIFTGYQFDWIHSSSDIIHNNDCNNRAIETL